MRPRTLVVALLLLPVAVAGCFGDADLSTDPGFYMTTGTLVDEPTANDRADLQAIVVTHGGELEMSPDGGRFTATGMSAPECDSLRGSLLARPYIRDVAECVHVVSEP